MDPTGPTARRFPLIARPRPACTPLGARVRELCALASLAERDADQSSASAVFNQAALLASDVGLPDLAREWCRQHAEAYLRARPLGAQSARRALEPLVNLARLQIRDGDGQAAFRLLDDLYRAVTSGTDTVVVGIHVPAATLTATQQDHHELRQWLWTVHLADGTRALTSVGRWQDAHAHLLHHKGIGRRMLDGRQVAIIARTTAGDPAGGLALLTGTVPGDPWENAVTACLTVLCRRHADQPTDRDVTAMLEHYRQLAFDPRLVAFHTRLALTVIDATHGIDHPDIRPLATDLIHRTTAVRDGYAAREVLAHPGCADLLTEQQRKDLTELLDACALGSRVLPTGLHTDLLTALDTSEAVLMHTLAPGGRASVRQMVDRHRL